MAVQKRGFSPETITGVSAGPGTETSITVTPVSRKRLDVPYNECNNDEQQRNGTTSRSASSCVDECLQDMVRVYNNRHFLISLPMPIKVLYFYDGCTGTHNDATKIESSISFIMLILFEFRWRNDYRTRNDGFDSLEFRTNRINTLTKLLKLDIVVGLLHLY